MDASKNADKLAGDATSHDPFSEYVLAPMRKLVAAIRGNEDGQEARNKDVPPSETAAPVQAARGGSRKIRRRERLRANGKSNPGKNSGLRAWKLKSHA